MRSAIFQKRRGEEMGTAKDKRRYQKSSADKQTHGTNIQRQENNTTMNALILCIMCTHTVYSHCVYGMQSMSTQNDAQYEHTY